MMVLTFTAKAVFLIGRAAACDRGEAHFIEPAARFVAESSNASPVPKVGHRNGSIRRKRLRDGAHSSRLQEKSERRHRLASPEAT